MKRSLILFGIFFLLLMLEMGFFVHFRIFNYIPNLIILFVAGVNIIEEQERKTGIVLAFLGGFFLDVFSNSFFGVWTLALVLFSLLLKYFLKRLLRFSFSR